LAIRCPGTFVASFVALALAGCGSSTEPPPPPPSTPTADIEASVDGPGPLALGEDASFTVRVHNKGPDGAEQVSVQASLVGAFDLVSISNGGELSGSTVTWPNRASLAKDASLEFTIVVHPTAEGSVSVTGQAGSDTEDPDPANNDGSAAAASASADVTVQADLAIAAPTPGAADGGDTIVVTLTATNAGPSPASDVIVTDSLPEAVEVVSISDGGTRNGQSITWPAVASLEVGGSVAYDVELVVPHVGPLRMVQRVGAGSEDPVSGNDRMASRTVVTATPVLTIQGTLAGEQFGWEVRSVGDLTGDGAADLAISGPFGSNGGNQTGSVYLYSGDDGSLIRRIDGADLDWFGVDMSVDTDFTGDGVPDLVVGAPGSSGFGLTGRAYIVSPVDGTIVETLSGEQPDDRFGYSAASAGDVDGDGIPDLYVGARDSDAGGTDAGRAYVYSGADWSLLFTLDGTAGDHFGQTGGGVGDLNNDGFDDIAIGAPDYGPTANPGRGRVYVISGANGQNLYAPIEADGTAINFGYFWVLGAGDLSGDGVPDILASDINNAAGGGDTGRLYVLSGTNGVPLFTLTGESPGDQYGITHPTEDLDGDGTNDIIVAAWLSSEGASQAGKIYLVSGATGETLRTITSTVAGENFGFDAFVIGDATGDGIPDIAVSGGISNSAAGHVKLYAGVEP
jgi:uncharacterized repeat protein (TIGR01451 family)